MSPSTAIFSQHWQMGKHPIIQAKWLTWNFFLLGSMIDTCIRHSLIEYCRLHRSRRRLSSTIQRITTPVGFASALMHNSYVALLLSGACFCTALLSSAHSCGWKKTSCHSLEAVHMELLRFVNNEWQLDTSFRRQVPSSTALQLTPIKCHLSDYRDSGLRKHAKKQWLTHPSSAIRWLLWQSTAIFGPHWQMKKSSCHSREAVHVELLRFGDHKQHLETCFLP